MLMIACHLVCHSNSEHLSQIFTGFFLLHQSGTIHLSQECKKQDDFDLSKPQHLRDASHTHLLVIVNRRIRLYYDCHDSYEIDEPAAQEVDCYFKRSYAQSKLTASLKNKVFPLGLNYELYPAEFDDFARDRHSVFEPASSTATAPLFRPTIENMHSLPDRQALGILFMTRAWDPYDHPDRAKEKIEERVLINETRARCIELLRKQFGNRFLGGFSHTDYAAKNYASVLLQDNKDSGKQDYIKLLSRYAICVATTGLHQSIGWKMAEYVAFSKAIVSEKLNYQIPGDFKSGKNYLQFSEPEQCVEAVHTLLSNADLRYAMMQANHSYYLTSLKPDNLIRRTLEIALATNNY
jgi:hypothetical protein